MYGADTGAAATGPTLAGCSIAGGALTVRFNATLLGTDSVAVQPHGSPPVPPGAAQARARIASTLRVLIDPAYWCANTTLR